jgi:hypothetical protein
MKSQSSDGALSLEETRLLNIARNNDFLKNLFGAPPSEGADGKEVASKVSKDEPKIQMEKWARFDEDFVRSKRTVIGKYPVRRAQIEDIAGYLNPVRIHSLVQKPPIVMFLSPLSPTGLQKRACFSTIRPLRLRKVVALQRSARRNCIPSYRHPMRWLHARPALHPAHLGRSQRSPKVLPYFPTREA